MEARVAVPAAAAAGMAPQSFALKNQSTFPFTFALALAAKTAPAGWSILRSPGRTRT